MTFQETQDNRVPGQALRPHGPGWIDGLALQELGA